MISVCIHVITCDELIASVYTAIYIYIYIYIEDIRKYLFFEFQRMMLYVFCLRSDVSKDLRSIIVAS